MLVHRLAKFVKVSFEDLIKTLLFRPGTYIGRYQTSSIQQTIDGSTKSGAKFCDGDASKAKRTYTIHATPASRVAQVISIESQDAFPYFYSPHLSSTLCTNLYDKFLLISDRTLA